MEKENAGGAGWVLSALMFAALAAPFAQADDATIRVKDAWARRAAAMQRGDAKAGSGNGAVYVTLRNSGKEPDALIGAETDAAAAAEIHETYRDMGMMMMRQVRKVDLPAGKEVSLKPGGYHVMLISLKRDLKAGETLRLTLQFEKAGKIPVIATVK